MTDPQGAMVRNPPSVVPMRGLLAALAGLN
jgi:hypothetical protein